MDRAKLPNSEPLQFALAIEDNGKGFPKEIDLKNPESLGLELVNLLLEKIGGCTELKKC